MTAEARRPWGGREVPCLYPINGVMTHSRKVATSQHRLEQRAVPILWTSPLLRSAWSPQE